MVNDYLTSWDGTPLRTRTWLSQDPHANIIFCHGLFEYAGRYDYEARYFNEAGYNFYAYDQRSHGESAGKRRAYIRSFDNYIQDYKSVVDQLSKTFDTPYFLFSHSMGCTVMLSYLVKEKLVSPLFKGVIMSGPFIKSVDDMSPILQKFAGIIGRLFPAVRTIKARPNSISRDPEEVRKYINDPLVYTDGIYAVTGYQMLKQSDWLQTQLAKFDYPFILMHGTDDTLADIIGSKRLYQESPSTDKTFTPLLDHKHEITRELERDKVLQAMVDWAEARV